MRIAFIHEWLVTYAGSERVLEQMLKCFPEADLFCLIDFLPDADRSHVLNKPVRTTFIQRLPFAKTKYRQYLSLMPLAIEQLDVSAYDVIISSNHAVAKGVITGPDQLHICMCYSPMRYAWDLQHQYLSESGLDSGLKGWIAKWMLHKLRLWDARSEKGVDHFIAISRFIGRRIWKVYGRKSTVIYPPVDVESFTLREQKEDFYLAASRMVPYKKIGGDRRRARFLQDSREGRSQYHSSGISRIQSVERLHAAGQGVCFCRRRGLRNRSSGGAGMRHSSDCVCQGRRRRNDQRAGLRKAHRGIFRNTEHRGNRRCSGPVRASHDFPARLPRECAAFFRGAVSKGIHRLREDVSS
jgi:Glycosyltransferase Family 4